MGKSIKKGQEIITANDERELAKYPGYLVHKMIVRNIESLLKKGRMLEHVTISRMKYDMLEGFYEKFGFRTEDNYEAPLTCHNIEVKRAETGTMEEFVPTFKSILSEKELLTKLDQNVEEMGIGGNLTIGQQAVNDAYKAIKNAKRG